MSKQPEFSIVRQDRFIEATRDSGYKGTESALSELIDNSIQAGAKRVAIKIVGDGEAWSHDSRPKAPKVMEIVIADNGSGMDAKTLRRSLRFGDSSRFNDRTGLGRFGMGLPNASVSQCERVEVFSWTSKDDRQRPLWTYIDVKEIAHGTMDEVPEPTPSPIPAPYDENLDRNHGTVVVWKRFDRIDHDKVDSLERAIRHSLGRIFRHFINAELLTLIINGEPVAPFDPLYLMPRARLSGDPLAMKYCEDIKFAVQCPSNPSQSSIVEVSLSLLPDDWQINHKKDKEFLKRRHLENREVFSMVRANREIDLIRDPYRAAHWTSDRWYRVEVRFDPALDELFGVTHTKQHAKLRKGTPIFEKLRAEIDPNIKSMIERIKARAKKINLPQSTRAEEAVQAVLPRLKPVEVLAEKPPTQARREIRDFLARLDKTPQDRRQLEDRLSRYEMVVEREHLPGAPFYRSEVIGRSIVVLINTAHRFFERVYQRIELDSPEGKTGIDLLIMALARSEALSGEELAEWYDDQRQEWSQHLKIFAEQLDEPDLEDLAPRNGD